jgi:hypothetical protein
VQERITVLRQVSGMLGFLFVSDAEFVVDPGGLASFDERAVAVLRASVDALSAARVMDDGRRRGSDCAPRSSTASA